MLYRIDISEYQHTICKCLPSLKIVIVNICFRKAEPEAEKGYVRPIMIYTIYSGLRLICGSERECNIF